MLPIMQTTNTTAYFATVFQDKNKVAAAAVSNHDVFSVRLSDEATIFTAEAKAIQLASELIKISKDTYFTIFSDSFLFTILSIYII